MKRDTVTCRVCRTVIGRRKTIHADAITGERRCADYDACRERRMVRDEERRREAERAETNRWVKQYGGAP